MYKFKGEEKLDVCADIAAPFFEIFTDPAIAALQKSNAPVADYIKPILKTHKKQVVEILARVQSAEGITPEEYLKTAGIMSIPLEFLALLSDKEMTGLFNSQGQENKTSSGSAMENTEVSGK